MASVPQEDSPKLMEGEQQSISISLEVAVTSNPNGHATVAFPPELRPSERLVSFLANSLRERGLELKYWRLSAEQKVELESLPNVMVREESGD